MRRGCFRDPRRNPHPLGPTLPLDVLHADLKAIDTAILALRLRIVAASGRDAFELGRYLDETVRRRAEVEGDIASLSALETTQ